MAQFLRHELKNSYIGIKTSLDLIERRAKQQQDISSYLQRAHKSMAIMNTLLNGAAEASTLEAALHKETLHYLDLSSIIAAHTELYKNIYPDYVIKLNCHPNIIILGNEIRLQQLLDKLIANAIDHCDDSEKTLWVEVTQNHEYAYLNVTNIGSLLPEDKNIIFDLFVSMRPHERQTTENSGLGLYIVKLIAESHGGYAYASDLENRQGAKLTVVLPLPFHAETEL